MKDTKGKVTFLPPEDQEFLDDFKRQWNDCLAQMHPLVDISPEGIDALCREAVRRNNQKVARTRMAYSIAACIAALFGVAGAFYSQLGGGQPGMRYPVEVAQAEAPSLEDGRLIAHAETRPQTTNRPVLRRERVECPSAPAARPHPAVEPAIEAEDIILETSPWHMENEVMYALECSQQYECTESTYGSLFVYAAYYQTGGGMA